MKIAVFLLIPFFYKISQHDEALLNASSDVTEALKRTSTLMQQELEKSTFSASMLGKF
jgi:protein transport protein SEC20